MLDAMTAKSLDVFAYSKLMHNVLQLGVNSTEPKEN